MKRTVSLLTITLLLVSMFTATFSIRAVETGLSPLTVPDEPATMQETINLASQEAPPTEWNKTYGGTDNDPTWALVETGDGGYAARASSTLWRNSINKRVYIWRPVYSREKVCTKSYYLF